MEPTKEQLDTLDRILSGYIWWTGPDGYRLSRSRGNARSGTAPHYTLTCPYPNERQGTERTYKHRRFWTDAEAIEWAKKEAAK